MFIGTHTCVPVLAALGVDALRLHRGRNRLFPKSHLMLIALAGALQDLLHPHLALSSRYSSWTHTLWFLLAVYPVFGIICRTWFRPRWILLTHCMWLAACIHLATDTLANGTRPLYPFGPVISLPMIPHWIWFCSDFVLIAATVLMGVWIERRDRPESSNKRISRALNVLPVLAIGMVALLILAPTVDRVKSNLHKDPAAKLMAGGLAHRNLKARTGVNGAEDVSRLIEPIRAKSMLPCWLPLC